MTEYTGRASSRCVLYAVAASLAVLFGAGPVSAQISAAPASRLPDYPNSVGLGASAGPFIGRDASFWGLAADYSRALKGPWSVTASLAFDLDSEHKSDGTTKHVGALNFVGMISYTVRRLTFTTGLAKGFAGTDNADEQMRFASGDWGTGLAVGMPLPVLSGSRSSLSVSVGYEYNLSQSEPDISFDIAYGFAF